MYQSSKGGELGGRGVKHLHVDRVSERQASALLKVPRWGHLDTRISSQQYYEFLMADFEGTIFRSQHPKSIPLCPTMFDWAKCVKTKPSIVHLLCLGVALTLI